MGVGIEAGIEVVAASGLWYYFAGINLWHKGLKLL
jgi:hypothetical protein